MWLTNPSSESLSIYNACYDCINIYRLALDTADETGVSHIVIHYFFVVTQTCEGVDNNTENNVEEHYNNHHEIGEILSCADIVNGK